MHLLCKDGWSSYDSKSGPLIIQSWFDELCFVCVCVFACASCQVVTTNKSMQNIAMRVLNVIYYTQVCNRRGKHAPTPREPGG